MSGPNAFLGGKSNLLKFFGVYVNSIVMCHKCKVLVESFFLHVEGQYISQESLSHINLGYRMLFLESNHLETKFHLPNEIVPLKTLEASYSVDIEF
jgi:hypothetical protein